MNDPFEHLPEGVKLSMDLASLATMIGTLAQWLPEVAALFTILWTALRIYESRTIQRWLGKSEN
jgi:hypothetical protein